MKTDSKITIATLIINALSLIVGLLQWLYPNK